MLSTGIIFNYFRDEPDLETKNSRKHFFINPIRCLVVRGRVGRRARVGLGLPDAVGELRRLRQPKESATSFRCGPVFCLCVCA